MRPLLTRIGLLYAAAIVPLVPVQTDLQRLQVRMQAYATDPGMANLHVEDGCAQRAQKIANDLGLEQVRKIWVFSTKPNSMVVTIPNTNVPNQWAFHVAAVANAQGQNQILDPALGRKLGLLSYERWQSLFVKAADGIEVVSTPAFILTGFKWAYSDRVPKEDQWGLVNFLSAVWDGIQPNAELIADEALMPEEYIQISREREKQVPALKPAPRRWELSEAREDHVLRTYHTPERDSYSLWGANRWVHVSRSHPDHDRIVEKLETSRRENRSVSIRFDSSNGDILGVD